MAFRYPVDLELSGRRCLVVGGGPEAEAKARALLEADADVLVVTETPTDGLTDLGRRGELEILARHYRPGDLEGVFLVITTDRRYNDAVFAEAETKRVLCNAVDDVAHCHFAVPALVRRGELLLTVSTGGRAPALAKRLRRRLAGTFGSEYGALVDLLGEVRDELRPRRTGSFAAWAGRWETVAAEEADLIRLVTEGRIDEAKDRVRRMLEDQPAARNPARTSAHRSGSVR
jgi:siroheme synthase-like protein